MSEYNEPFREHDGDPKMIILSNGTGVARVCHKNFSRRIIRCVNAFAGVPDSTIDAIAAEGGVSGLLEMLRELYYEQKGRHVNGRAQALLKAIEGK